jgi:serine/threonine protein kinase
MLDADNQIYLMDFGLAKTVEQSGVTQTGAVIGTPHYMSPEQVTGLPAGPQSDIYSLGIILYEMLTGVLPFTGKSVFEVMMQRVQKSPRPAAEFNSEIPGYLQKILDRCPRSDPTLRYQSAGEILADSRQRLLPPDDALPNPSAALALPGPRPSRRWRLAAGDSGSTAGGAPSRAWRRRRSRS